MVRIKDLGDRIMRWQGREQSKNVEDRRGMRPGKVAAGGGLLAIIAAIVAMFLGGDPSALFKLLGGGRGGSSASSTSEASQPIDPKQEPIKQFVSTVLKDTEDVWHGLFRGFGERYREPKLVIYSGVTQSACGLGESAMGPFYCPPDERVFIDLDFAEELHTKFKAPGDFALAYVVAHEIGHHVQNLLGRSAYVHKQKGKVSDVIYNQLSVRLELQADFYAGVYVHHAQRTKQILDPGDLEEAMRAASAVGDDRIQKQSRGYAVPDSFTHGTSEQRMRWFRKGLETGDMRQGETFDIPYESL